MVQGLRHPFWGRLRPIKDREGGASTDLDVVMSPPVPRARGACQPHPQNAAIELERGFHGMRMNGDVIDICALKHGVLLHPLAAPARRAGVRWCGLAQAPGLMARPYLVLHLDFRAVLTAASYFWLNAVANLFGKEG